MSARLLGASIVLLMASCTPPRGAGTASGLGDLQHIGDLQSRFDADAGSVRIVLLMSPT